MFFTFQHPGCGKSRISMGQRLMRPEGLHCVYRVVYGTHHGEIFGDYIRQKRMLLQQEDRRFSLRQVARRIGMEPSYLSKLERGESVHLSEEKTVALARELREDPDLLLALNGRVSSDVQAVIRKRPALFARLIREMKDLPDRAVLRIVREVRDGEW